MVCSHSKACLREVELTAGSLGAVHLSWILITVKGRAAGRPADLELVRPRKYTCNLAASQAFVARTCER